MINKNLHIIVLTVMLCAGFSASAQFYNGHQMTFGKSRVQYNDFYWQYYRFPKFDTYFYVGGSNLAEYVSKVADQELENIEYSLEEILQRRMIFIVYNKQSEFKQSNIGLVTGVDDYNIGGVTRIVDNKVFLYYEGDHEKLKKQIRASITEVIINEMLYGGNFRERVSSSTMLNLPEWFVPGLISYIAYDTDFDTEAKIKSTILKGKSRKIHQMHGEDAKIAGHAFWRYLAETYGDPIVSQIVYMSRISKNVESGFLYVLGMPLKDVLNDWFYYYQGRYRDEVADRAGDPTDAKAVGKTRKKYTYNQVKMAPSGNYIAYTTHQVGQYKIWLYDTQKEKIKLLVKRENKLEQITDNSYPLLAWHPQGDILTYIYERKGHIWLDFYDLETRETQSREVFYLDKVLDYSFSHDAQQIALSAVEDGYTDIYTYSLSASTFSRITNDIADDLNPHFIAQSEKIIFSSNRVTTQLKFEKGEESPYRENYDIFICNLGSKQNELTRITDTWRVDELQPMEYKTDRYFFLTNQNGIFNRGYAAYDSTISFIDTAIHYRNFTRNYPISNNAYNINDYDFDSRSRLFADAVKKTKTYSLYTSEVNPALRPKPDEFQDTWFKNHYLEKKEIDSLMLVEIEEYKADTLMTDIIPYFLTDSLIDINNYIFESEKEAYLKSGEPTEKKSTVFMLPKQMVYFTNFYSNLLVTQVDFGFMNQSYQAFTGSAFYFNPGFNILTKIGAIDLFEDYKITGGIRFSVDFESNEYLLSVENLKRRLDKQYIYHRQVFESFTVYEYSKIFTNELMAVYKYPITQIHAFRGTISARLDEQVFKSLDPASLLKPNTTRFWGGLKGEFILDNTRSLGLNTLDGTRLKVYGEYYNQISTDVNTHLFVVGADVRNYFPLHRDLIFASRFAYSTSFGKSLLMYYLGGVDNWMNFSQNTSTFDYSTDINSNKDWVFQAVATNMRGFIQNVRNGNSFAVANFELRWPVIRYLFNRPVSSDFLNNFMVVGFTDVGSAWEGFNPANAINAYDYRVIPNGPITVVIDRKHSPMVAGVGFGLRTRLLGYYVRTDWAWGIDGGRVLPRVFYLSLCTDF